MKRRSFLKFLGLGALAPVIARLVPELPEAERGGQCIEDDGHGEVTVLLPGDGSEIWLYGSDVTWTVDENCRFHENGFSLDFSNCVGETRMEQETHWFDAFQYLTHS